MSISALKEDTEKGKKLERSIAKKAAIHQEIKGLEAQINYYKRKKGEDRQKNNLRIITANGKVFQCDQR